MKLVVMALTHAAESCNKIHVAMRPSNDLLTPEDG
jgi:hypothetical protein